MQTIFWRKIDIKQKNRNIKTMKREAFKPGQVAYEISPEKGVLLTKLRPTDCDIYTVLGQAEAYTFDGCIFKDGRLPSLFRATEDNYKKLCAFFGEGAVPKLPLSPREIMIELLKGGGHSAFVSIHSHETARIHRNLTLIVGYADGFFWSQDDAKWDYVIPCDSRGNEITELPE